MTKKQLQERAQLVDANPDFYLIYTYIAAIVIVIAIIAGIWCQIRWEKQRARAGDLINEIKRLDQELKDGQRASEAGKRPSSSDEPER